MREKPDADAALAARRQFLATCGKFAIATPPAVTLILSQTRNGYATASSGGHGGHGGSGGYSGGKHHKRHGKRGGHSGGRGRGHSNRGGRGRGHS